MNSSNPNFYVIFQRKNFHLKSIGINTASHLFNPGENDASQMYWAVEQKCRKFLKKMAHFYILNETVFVIVFIYSFYCLFTENVDVWSLPLSFNMIVPFNTKTIFGWYLLWFIQFCMSSFYALSMIAMTSYFISCCLYIRAACDHFNMVINSIDDEIESNQLDNDGSNGPKNYQKLKRNVSQKLSRAIGIHVNIFE